MCRWVTLDDRHREAHPRGRGGNAVSEILDRMTEGLSPRTRGKHQHGTSHERTLGPIPADAGETRRGLSLDFQRRAYPRGRGGNIDYQSGIATLTGLSPRTRGKQGRYRIAYQVIGPIPADAGETSGGISVGDGSRAYPRGRGGNSRAGSAGLLDAGLSPRTRGKHRNRDRPRAGGGPIPADAGETVSNLSFHLGAGAYPRGRGGNGAITAKWTLNGGLSPRTRGKQNSR